MAGKSYARFEMKKDFYTKTETLQMDAVLTDPSGHTACVDDVIIEFGKQMMHMDVSQTLDMNCVF